MSANNSFRTFQQLSQKVSLPIIINANDNDKNLQQQQKQDIPTAKQILLNIRIQEKQKEYENLLKMKKSSEELAEYFDQLALQIQQLNEGCEVIAGVLRNWQNVFNFVEPENITAENYSKIILKKSDSSNNDISNA